MLDVYQAAWVQRVNVAKGCFLVSKNMTNHQTKAMKQNLDIYKRFSIRYPVVPVSVARNKAIYYDNIIDKLLLSLRIGKVDVCHKLEDWI